VGQRFSVVALAVLLAATQLSAQVEPPAYRGLIAQAVEAFDDARYDEARALFEQAHTSLPNPRALRGVGLCAMQTHDYAGAYRAFADALTIPAAGHALTGAMRREVTRGRRDARAHLAAVSGIPRDALVLVDSTATRIEPDGTVLMAEGPHVVVVELAGGGRSETRVQIVAGHDAILAIAVATSSSPSPITPPPTAPSPIAPPPTAPSPIAPPPTAPSPIAPPPTAPSPIVPAPVAPAPAPVAPSPSPSRPPAFSLSPAAQLGPYGHLDGGGPFDDSCPSGAALVGLRGRYGGNIDTVQGVCGALALAPSSEGWTAQVLATSLLGEHGANRTTPFALDCPPGTLAVGLTGQAGQEGTTGITLLCAALSVDSIGRVSRGPILSVSIQGTYAQPPFDALSPEPMLVTRLLGRSGMWVDAIGVGLSSVSVSPF
jgi:hypothetical protein